MKIKSEKFRQEFNRFSTDMVHGVFPGMDLVQLEPGPLQGWTISARVGPYHVKAGSFDRVLLYDGRYNPEMVHVGFISSGEHTATSQAHAYSSGVISLDYGSSYMHEVFPADMVWVNIFASEAVVMKGIHYSRKKLHGNPHLLLEGSRDELMPLIDLVNEIILKPSREPAKSNSKLEARFRSILHTLLSSRFAEDIYKQPFVAGDMFRMSLLNKIEKLFLTNGNRPLSLDDICTVAKMKRRTIQKYFHEIYGMGPTEYFRIRRLNGARADFMNGATSVSGVAIQWGFTHFGRFSEKYKTIFNESPRSTIKQANASSRLLCSGDTPEPDPPHEQVALD